MSLSRSARITLLLIIDIVFFFTELIIGYAVGSLALVADSFHMLNDVMSLVVALYAIKMSTKAQTDARYSYGWHRAEILAALINGVFLLALCLSIFLEAMGRFFSTPEIANPKLIVVVGACGLASNLLGLLLFHEHGHSHSHEDYALDSHKHDNSDSQASTPHEAGRSVPIAVNPRPNAASEAHGHPAVMRASFSQAAEDIRRVRSPSPTTRRSYRQSYHISDASVDSHAGVEGSDTEQIQASHALSVVSDETTPLISTKNVSSQPPASHDSHSHSHGSMNMRAILLHVLGDALGNVGVIATGLVIWLTEWSFKYYFDPMISLVITVIIFLSALPLVKSTAFILLQGVPSTISLDEVREAILQVKGVLSVHELHIWQLSETKVVASVHIGVSREHEFMPIAAEIQVLLHHRGIHSSTIQPEYHFEVTTSDQSRRSSCLINCPQDMRCSSDNTCCPPPTGV